MGTKPPNILLIVLDAARAEDFSILGYGKPTTPNLERYGEQLACYRNCISAATWTLPSTTGLFTGTYPSTHRLVIDGDRLHPKFTTLPEILTGRGYFTAKVTGQVPYVSSFSGLDRGFQEEFEPAVGGLRKWWRARRRKKAGNGAGAVGAGGSQEGVDLGLDLKTEAQMNAQGGLKWRAKFWASGSTDSGASACFDHVRAIWQDHSDAPRFVYMHLQETHAEYRPPHRYRTKFVPRELRGRNFAVINQRPNPHAVGLVKMTEEDYAILTGLYDGCIAYLDEQIGRLLDEISRRPDFDDTLVIVTADHGDCIGRHGVLGHQFVCYEELVRIPWIVKWPKSVGLAGARDEVVQNVDLVATLAELVGFRKPDECEGIDILHESREVAASELLKPFGRSAIQQGLHTMAPHYHRAVLAVRSRGHKLIRYSNHQADEFFDLNSDVRESKNLLTESGGLRVKNERNAAAFELLRARISELEPRWREAAEEINDRLFGEDAEDISPEVEERLRALGYLD